MNNYMPTKLDNMDKVDKYLETCNLSSGLRKNMWRYGVERTENIPLKIMQL